MSVHADVGIRANDSGHGHCSTEVCQGLDCLPIPRNGEAESPGEVRDEEYDSGLVETVQHVHPEFESSVLETPDTPDV